MARRAVAKLYAVLETSDPTLFLTRRALLGAALASGSLLLGGCTKADSRRGLSDPPTESSTGTPTPAQSEAFPAPYVALFPSRELNFEALSGLGSAGVNSEVGEVLTAVQQAHAAGGGPAGYYTAYRTLADRLAASAGDARPVTARARYLRAAKYYSQALFVVLGSDTPEAEEEVYREMNSAWSAAAALSRPAWEKLAIPFEGGTMPGWFCAPPGESGARPTVIISNGSDGQSIDLLAYGVQAALERGYNAVLYDGPGQGESFFVRGLPFRGNWETVVTPIVDYLLQRPDVDPSRLALTGWSMSGDLVARAAAFETRLAAVVSDTGLHSPWLAFPKDLRELAEAGDRETVNRIWLEEVVPNVPDFEAYYLKKRFSIFSTTARDEARAGKIPTDFYGLAQAVRSLDLSPEVMSSITRPYLVTDYEDEMFYAGQAKVLYDALSGPKTFHKFTDEARYHCAPMAPTVRNEVVFDWLDETLGR